MPSPKQLRDLYRFPGFVPLAGLQVFACDAQAVLLTLRRRQKNGLRRVWADVLSLV